MADGDQQHQRQQRILQKLVHASERQWARLVIPGKQVPYFTAMQAELKAQGQDISIFVRDAPPGTRTWRWLCRMTVQRPMILDLGSFYEHHNVCAGDTVSVWRSDTNVLTVELERGPGAAAVQSEGAVGMQPAAMQPAVAAAPLLTSVPVFAAGQLPGQAWTLGPRGGKRSGSSHGSQRSQAAGAGEVEEEEEEGSPGGYVRAPDSDYDYSPRAKIRNKRAGGPLAVRRALQKVQPESSGGEGSDQESTHAYTAEQTRRFDALLDVVAQVSQPSS